MESYYQHVETALQLTKTRATTIIISLLKLGRKQILYGGNFGLRVRSERVDRLVLIRHLYTLKSPQDTKHHIATNQIDLLLIYDLYEQESNRWLLESNNELHQFLNIHL